MSLADSVIDQTFKFISIDGSPKDLQFAGSFNLSMHDRRKFAKVIHFLKSNQINKIVFKYILVKKNCVFARNIQFFLLNLNSISIYMLLLKGFSSCLKFRNTRNNLYIFFPSLIMYFCRKEVIAFNIQYICLVYQTQKSLL